MKIRLTSSFLATVAALVATAGAQAAPTLIGDEVTVRFLSPDQQTVFRSENVTVGPGPEVTCPGQRPLCNLALPPGTSFDIGALSISASLGNAFFFNASFNGFEFAGLDFGGGDLIGFTLTTDIPGFTASDISFDARTLRMNLAGSLASADGRAFDIQLQVGPNAVPLPGTLALAALGLSLLATSRRRRS